jgi:uncharacterized protein (TIGR04255 family)
MHEISQLKLAKPPIVEAVVDIDCDMPPATDLAALESRGRDLFSASYPTFHSQLIQEHEFKQEIGAAPEISVRQRLHALQFLHDDAHQLVQVRAMGFSFNRLAPYSGLDDYLPEIKRTWALFTTLATPVQIRAVRLRYINRILLPLTNGRVELDEYLKLGPRLPDEERLTFAGFLNQHAVVEAVTGNQANIVLTTQPQLANDLPLIFDIEATSAGNAEPGDWPWIETRIQSLRSLKNHIFRNTLTDKCLKLFQQ